MKTQKEVISCRFCDKKEELILQTSAIKRFNAGKDSIQKCFPELTPDQREMIKTNTCGDCWKKMYGNG